LKDNSVLIGNFKAFTYGQNGDMILMCGDSNSKTLGSKNMETRSSSILIPLIRLGAVLLAVGVVAWVATTNIIAANLRNREEKAIANALGVKREDYPASRPFPGSYFETVLKPGMTIQKVHEIVQGYMKATSCGVDEELYYFYGTDNETADRILFLYNQNDLKFQSYREEDKNSHAITTKNCLPGLLKP
jgi:hypothetical protein